MSLIVLDRLKKVFGHRQVTAVDGLSLAVREAEILALLGPSGCGKTTILRLIAGFEVPDEGPVTIRRRLVSGGGRWVPPEDRGVGIVFQDYALFPHLSVAENAAFGLFRFDPHVRGRRAGEVLDLVGLGGGAGPASLPTLEGRPLGPAVEVMIRPDDIDFIPRPDGDAVVSVRHFRGYENLYRLRLPSGLSVRSSQPSTTLYPAGTRVRVVAALS